MSQLHAFCCHLSIATEGGEGDWRGLRQILTTLGWVGEIFVHDLV